MAAATIVALLAASAPALAESTLAELNGVVRSADRAPLAGVRLLAAHAASATVHRSEPTSEDGNFSLGGLPPGTYELAVELESGLYVVRDSLELVPGVRRTVQIAVGENAGAGGDAASSAQPISWNSPFWAGAIVLGFAIVIGVLVKNATDDEFQSTPN